MKRIKSEKYRCVELGSVTISGLASVCLIMIAATFKPTPIEIRCMSILLLYCLSVILMIFFRVCYNQMFCSNCKSSDKDLVSINQCSEDLNPGLPEGNCKRLLFAMAPPPDTKFLFGDLEASG